MARDTPFVSKAFPQLAISNPSGINRARRTTPTQNGAANTPVASSPSASPAPAIEETASQIAYPINDTSSITITATSASAKRSIVLLGIVQSVEPKSWLTAILSSTRLPLLIVLAAMAARTSSATPVETAEATKRAGKRTVLPHRG